MPTYGILLVDTSWSNDNTAQIEKDAFTRHKAEIGADTIALIYMREPIDAVVAEAEITSNVIEAEAELLQRADAGANALADVPADRDAQIAPTMVTSIPNRTPNLGVAHEFHVPLKVLRLKG